MTGRVSRIGRRSRAHSGSGRCTSWRTSSPTTRCSTLRVATRTGGQGSITRCGSIIRRPSMLSSMQVHTLFPALLRSRDRGFAGEKHDRARRVLQHFGSQLAEEELLARAGADTHHEQRVTAALDFPQDGIPRRPGPADDAVYVDAIVLADIDDLTDGRAPCILRSEYVAESLAPGAHMTHRVCNEERLDGTVRALRERDGNLGCIPRQARTADRHE